MNAQRFQPSARDGGKKAFQICSGLAVVILLGNTGALIDTILHPEIPYFDKEHLIVGGVTAFVIIVLLGLIARYVRHLEEALTEVEVLKDQAEQSCDEIETLVAKRTKELCESRERLAHILSSNPAVIYTAKLDSNYGPVFISDNVTAQLGYEPTEFLGDPSFWASHIHPEDVQRVLEELSELHEQGHSTHEYRFRHKDGSYLWIRDEMNLMKDENGTPIQVMGYRINVTDRKQAEEALRIAHDDLEIRVQERTAELRTINEKLLREIAERKGAEEALKLEREQLLSIFDSINEVISVIDSQTYEILYVNKFVKNQYGEDMIGGLCYKELHGLDRPCGYCTKEIAISFRGEPYRWDYHNPTSNKDYLATDRIIRWTDGRDAKFHLGIDVTERKKAEKDLRESRERLRVVLDAIPAAVFWKDRDSVYVGVNRAWLEAAGLNSSEEVVGKTDYDLPWETDQANSFREHDRKVMESGIPQYDTIEPYVRADGALAWAKTNKVPLRDLEGNVVGVLGTFEDITDRKHGEQALRESEERFRQVAENAGEWIWEVDANGMYRYCSSAVESILGYSPDELVGEKHFYDLFAPDVREDLKAAALAAFERREMIQAFVNPNVHKNGEVIILETSGSPVQDKQGTLLGYRGTDTNITWRKRAEESLRKSQERLELALQGGDLGLWDLHIPTGKAVTNQRTAEIVGYSLDEIEQSFSSWESFLHPDDRQRALEAFYKHLSGLTNYSEEEYRVRHKNGDWRWILSRGKITERDPDGKPLRMTGTFLDITERKLAESQAAEANEFREQIVSASPIGIAVYRADGQCVSANEELARIVGADKGRLLTQNFRNLSSWKDSGLLADAEEVLSGGKNNQREVYLTSTFGKSVWVNERMARFTFGGEQHLLTVFNDITERRRAEEELKFHREQLLSLFEGINEVILVIDPQTYEILYANTFTEDLYGKKLIGGLCYERLNGFDTPCGHCHNENIVKLQGQPHQWEYSNPILKRDFLATDRMIRWPDGRDVKFQVALDITERKEAQQEQDHLKAQLFQSQKMESIGTLAGGMAHDFNNLLTVVQGYSELLLMDKDERAPEYSDLRKIHEAGRRGAALVRDLLAFSRKADTNPRPVNLNHEVARIEKLLSRTIPKMIKINLHLAGGLAAINADPDRMGQVLMNLALNAEHAMPDGGELTIATGQIFLDENYCRSYPEMRPGDYVLLTVSDTGRGMDKETLEHIFEPFFTTKGVGKGTGLGLAMVYGIIQQHGGRITCYSEPGHGATFKIYLPAITEAETEGGTEPEQVLPRGGTETILLADDEDFVRDLGQTLLNQAGYTVLTAASGPDALDLYLKYTEQIALVILDLIMPEMGGDKCLEEILALNPHAKILISSGAAVQGKTKETVESGAKGFISKPFLLTEMLNTVREVLDSE